MAWAPSWVALRLEMELGAVSKQIYVEYLVGAGIRVGVRSKCESWFIMNDR